MGGPGSGNWYRWDSKTTTESQKRIDIRWLKKHGHLRPGTIGSLSWSQGSEETGSIRYIVEIDMMILKYRHRPQGGDWEQVNVNVYLSATACNYGGTRKWFICPNLNCNKRVAVLYGAGKYFLCRHCCGLVYSSKHENEPDRLVRKARNIRKRLGASNDLFEPIWEKPKNMHHKTFDQLRSIADDANDRAWLIMSQKFGVKI